MSILNLLEDILAERRYGDPEGSYVAKLHTKGLDFILKKIGEESAEVIMAAKDASRSGNNNDIIREIADLWFHSLVLLSHLEEPPSAVTAELERRLGVSGLVEKDGRDEASK